MQWHALFALFDILYGISNDHPGHELDAVMLRCRIPMYALYDCPYCKYAYFLNRLLDSGNRGSHVV